MRERLRLARAARGMTALQLGQMADVSEVRVFALERGRGRLRIEEASRLARALNVPPEEIAPELFEGVS